MLYSLLSGFIHLIRRNAWWLEMAWRSGKIVLQAERPEALNHGRAERLGITPPIVLHVRNLSVIPVYGCIP
jgi:hypothetical protein